MFEPLEWVRSVEVVWATWLASAMLLAFWARRMLSRGLRSRLRRLVHGERGAAYTLSYVLSVPVLVLLIALTVETTLILIVKLGTMYASYAAARSAAVWLSARPALGAEKARQAAVVAMAPFASSDPAHARGGGADSGAFISAFRRYARGTSVSDRYLAAKYALASAVLFVDTAVDSSRSDGDVVATVSYEMPLNVPGVGRFLGERRGPGGAYWVITVTSRAILQNEAPVTESGDLGIHYVSN